MIRVLHKLPDTRETIQRVPLRTKGEQEQQLLNTEERDEEEPIELPNAGRCAMSCNATDEDWGKKWKVFFAAFGLSSFYSLLSYFIPVLQNIPVLSWFGFSSATRWYWTLTPCTCTSKNLSPQHCRMLAKA